MNKKNSQEIEQRLTGSTLYLLKKIQSPSLVKPSVGVPLLLTASSSLKSISFSAMSAAISLSVWTWLILASVLICFTRSATEQQHTQYLHHITTSSTHSIQMWPFPTYVASNVSVCWAWVNTELWQNGWRSRCCLDGKRVWTRSRLIHQTHPQQRALSRDHMSPAVMRPFP